MVLEPRIVPGPEDIPIPDAYDLVIEDLTDQMIDFDESATDVVEICAVTGGDKTRVKVNERKVTDGDNKHFRRAKEAELQSWLDHKVFDVVRKEGCHKDRVMRVRRVLT